MCEGGNRKNRGRTGKGKREIKKRECGGEREGRGLFMQRNS